MEHKYKHNHSFDKIEDILIKTTYECTEEIKFNDTQLQCYTDAII